MVKAGIKTVAEVIEHMPIFGAKTILRDITYDLKRNPVIIRDSFQDYYLLSPKNIGGYDDTKKAIDTPLIKLPLFSSDALAADVLSSIKEHNTDYGVVIKDNRVLGIVSADKLVEKIAEDMKEDMGVEKILLEVMYYTGSLLWKVDEYQWDSEEARIPKDIIFFGDVKKILGFSYNELLKEPDLWIKHIYPPHRNNLMKTLSKDLPEHGYGRYICRYKHPKRGWIWLSSHLYLIKKYREYISFYGITKDITKEYYEDMKYEMLFHVYYDLSEKGSDSIIESSINALSEYMPIDAAFLIQIKRSNKLYIPMKWVRDARYEGVIGDYLSYLLGSSLCDKDAPDNTMLKQKGIALKKLIKEETLLYIPDSSDLGEGLFKKACDVGIKTLFFIPLYTQKDSYILALISFRRNAFNEMHRLLIEELRTTFASILKVWLYKRELDKLNKTLENRVKERTYELEVMYELSQKLRYAIDYDELFKLTLNELHKAVRFDLMAVLIHTNLRPRIYIYPTRPIDRELKEDIVKSLMDTFEEFSGERIDRNKFDITIHNFIQNQQPLFSIGSYFKGPIIAKEKSRCMGIMFIGAYRQNALSEPQIRLIQNILNQISLSMEAIEDIFKREKKRLESLIESLEDGVILIDKTKKVILTNPKGGAYLNSLSAVREGGLLENIGNIRVDDIINRNIVLPCEIRKNNRVFEVKANRVETGPEKGGWLITIRDVTKEKELNEKMETQERLATVGRLAAGIAHDFNNLLTPIMGYSQLYMEHGNVQEKIREVFRVIYDQTKKAADLITQVLDFSRKSLFRKQSLNLVPFLKEILKLLRRTIREDIEISLNIVPGDYVIKADPTGIEQIITNLAVNAQDAMPAGGKIEIKLFKKKLGSPELPFRDMKEGDWVILSFRDTGTGIPKDILPHIFEPFFTTKEVGKGTGLGLSQAYGIIRQHDGYIDVKTKEGEGTEFLLYFPAVRKEKELKEGEESLFPMGKGELILLIEDDKEVRDIIKEMLITLNYNVIVASNGKKGLIVFEERRKDISLVLMDMVMPELGGNKLIEELRKIKPDIKIVIISGYPLNEDIPAGISDYFAKPINFKELATKIRKAIEMEKNNGDDETRTRDLRRDRPAF